MILKQYHFEPDEVKAIQGEAKARSFPSARFSEAAVVRDCVRLSFRLDGGSVPEPDDADLLDLAWGLIANAHGGDWDEASAEWKAAAERWRDAYTRNARKNGDDESQRRPNAEA